MTTSPLRIARRLAAIALCLAAAAQPAAAAPPGFATYRLGDDVYRLDARPGATPVDISAALDRLSPRATDEWLNTSPNGRYLLISTQRFGCGDEACLVRVDSSVGHAEPVGAGRVRLYSDGFSAVSSDGNTVVYPQGGGAHARDLWMTHRGASSWSKPVNISAQSPFDRNMQPAISGDGRHVLFDCGAGLPGDAGTAICEVATTGGPVRTVVAPQDGPGGSASNEVHHADFAPDGSIVFEADWRGEQIWRLPHSARRPVRVSRVHDDNSPCVLPDGRIASLYLDRPGNLDGVHELRIATATGNGGREILANQDIADIGIGCG